jgi:hypothetical protein
MNPHELPLHTLLGVSPTSLAAPLHRRDLPQAAPTTGHGLAGVTARNTLAGVLGALPADDIGPTSPVFPNLPIEWADNSPHVVLLPAEDVVWIGLGEPRVVDDHVRFDLTVGRFVVRLRHGDDTLVVEGADRTVTVYADPGLPEGSPRGTLPVQAWLSPGAPVWLHHAVAEHLEGGMLSGALCAAGLVVRFAPYRARPTGAELRALVLSGEPPDAIRDARAALSGVEPADLALVETSATRHAGALRADLGNDSLALRLERDDLECVWVALRLVARGSDLRDALDAVDEAADAHALSLDDVPERLAAARREDHTAWWAR